MCCCMVLVVWDRQISLCVLYGISSLGQVDECVVYSLSNYQVNYTQSVDSMKHKTHIPP